MGEEGGAEPPNSDNTIVRRELFEGKNPDYSDAPEIDIAEIIAELEGKEATEISAMYDTIDHLVEHLFSTPPPEEAQCTLEFTFEDYRITLTQDGQATFMKVAE